MGAFSFRGKWPGHKDELSLASCAKVKNEWSHSSPLHGAIPPKHVGFHGV